MSWQLPPRQIPPERPGDDALNRSAAPMRVQSRNAFPDRERRDEARRAMTRARLPLLSFADASLRRFRIA